MAPGDTRTPWTAETVIEIATSVGSEEQNWIDFKEEYYVRGVPKLEAEFIKDIASFANTISDQDERYILVGFDDDGNLEGVEPDNLDYDGSGPRHICSCDESDIQEFLGGYISPLPDISFYQFEQEGVHFAILVIIPVNRKPSVIEKDLNDDSGNRVLHRGLVYTRVGSGKKVAKRENIQKIIDDRVEKRREEILDNIRHIVELNPDEVNSLGNAVRRAQDGIPVSPAEDAELSIDARLTRKPATNLAEQLDQDIARRKGRGDDFVNYQAIWTYYSNPDKLPLGEDADETYRQESIEFLTQSSLKHELPGTLWLEKTGYEHLNDILAQTPERYRRLLTACKQACAFGDEDLFIDILDGTSYRRNQAEFSDLHNRIDAPHNERLEFLRANNQYNLGHQEWSQEIQISGKSDEDLLFLIPELASQITAIRNSSATGRPAVNLQDEFKDAIVDIELTLSVRLFARDDLS